MAERVVSISAPTIVANKVTYVNQVVNTATPELITNVVVSGVITEVTTDTISSVVTGLGEESIPNPTLFKRAQEYPSVIDTASIAAGKTFADLIGTLDSFNVLIQYNRTFEETKTTSEVVDKIVGKGLVDLSDVSDQIAKAVYRPLLDNIQSLDTKTISVTKTLKDSIQNIDQARINITKPFIEIKFVTDVFSRTINYKRSFSDSIDATDDFLGQANIDDDQIARIGKNTVDYTTTSDIKLFNITSTKLDTALAQDQKAVSLAKIFFDSSAIAEQKYLEIDKVFLETKVLTDVVSASTLKTTIDITNTAEQTKKDAAKIILSTGVIVDNAAKQLLVPHLDNTSLQDQVVIQWSIARVFQETQQVISQLPNFDISLGKLDTISTPDQVAKTQTKIFLDSSSLFDSFNITVDFNRSFTDSISVTDDFLGLANIDDDQTARIGKGIVDVITIPHILSFDATKLLQDQTLLQNPVSLAITKPLSSSFDIADTSTRAVLKGIETQTNSIIDVFSTDNSKTLTSSFTGFDELAANTAKVFSELTYTSDSFSTQVDFKRTFLDFVAATDDFYGQANIDDDQVVRVGKQVNDLLSLLDPVSNAIVKIQLDNFASTDTTYKTPGKVVSEVLTTSDAITFLKYTSLLFYEAITSADSGFINNQSYFAGTYVEPGYVGTNTYFT